METDTTKTKTDKQEEPAKIEECKDIDVSKLPGEDKPVYDLTRDIKRELDTYPKIPDTETFDKFLTDWGKESLTLDSIVQKYRETYAKLGPQYKEAKGWGKEIEVWCEGTVGKKARAQIEELATKYTKNEHDICCTFISYRNEGLKYLDCRGIRERKTAETKADFELHKNFEATLKERLAGLKPFYDKAKKSYDDGKYSAVYATGLELQKALDNLGVLRTWVWRADQCAASPAYHGNIWTPEKLGMELATALRNFILARYQQFGANVDFYKKEKAKADLEKQKADNDKDTENYKKACEDFVKSRSDEFIKEAGNIPPDENSSTSSEGTPTQKSAQSQATGRTQTTASPAAK